MNTRITELLGRGKQILHEEGFLSFLKHVLLVFVNPVNKFLIKSPEKILLMPIVKKPLDKASSFYYFYYHKTSYLKTKEDSQFYQIIRNANKEHIDLGVFPERDVKALEKVVQMVLKERIMITEIGSWKGFSTAVLAKAVTGYNVKVFAVDHWMGSEGTHQHEYTDTIDLFSVFKRNMIALGVWDIVHPLVMDSQTASRIFADGILDLVFIDADHRYESVKNDILCWLPKLKDNGILCGHDCEGYYLEYPEEAKKMIDEHLGDDYLSALKCHPGVIKALHDCFHEKYSRILGSRIWYYTKGGADSITNT